MPNKIILAEDSETLAKLVAIKLTRAGYDVDWQKDGEAACRVITLEVPAGVILDIMMPKLSGIDLLERIRADESTKLLPVIMVTARAIEADVVRCKNSGATDYIVKPFRPEELLARVKKSVPTT